MNKTRISEALRLIADAIEHEEAAPEWYDQATSPLGRRRHLALARQGAFPCARGGRRVLVRVEHVDAYIASKTLAKVTTESDDDTEAERFLARLRGRKTA